MIANKSFHATGIDHDRRAAAFGKFSRHKSKRCFRHVLKRRAANQTESMTNRVEYFVRAGERARVRDRLAFAHFRATKLYGKNWFAFIERLLGDRHELIGATNAFDHQREDF